METGGTDEGGDGCEGRSSCDLPVEVRGGEEGRGDEEEEEPRPLSLDYDRWMYHLSHHLRETEAKIYEDTAQYTVHDSIST